MEQLGSCTTAIKSPKIYEYKIYKYNNPEKNTGVSYLNIVNKVLNCARNFQLVFEDDISFTKGKILFLFNEFFYNVCIIH